MHLRQINQSHILLYKTVVFVLLIFISFNVHARVANDTIYTISTYDTFNFTEEVRKSNVIGKKISQVLVSRHPNLSRMVCDSLKIGPNDTVIVVKSYTGHDNMGHSADIKYGNKKVFVGLRYNWKKGNSKLDHFIIKPINDPSLYEGIEQNSYRFTDMIMLNVLFDWNIEDFKCLLKSSGKGTPDREAHRYILKNGKITEHSSIIFDEHFYWTFQQCYGKGQIPQKYLQDLRYESPDSTIEKYMHDPFFDAYFWGEE